MEIREIHDFNRQCIEEAVGKKTVKFISPFMVADGINKNQRRYPFPILNKAIEEYNGKIQAGKGYGGDYHPASGHLEIPDVSHRITKLYMSGKVAHVEGEILTDNEKGKKILSLIKAGSTIGLSARGFGEMKQGKDKVNELQPGYKMVGIDFVLNPSENIATVNQSNIFESAEIEEEKFDIDINEFNRIVNKTIEHEFLISFPDANFLEPNTKKALEKYIDEHWATYAEIIEKELKPLKVEKTELEKAKGEVEIYTSEEQAYDEAICAGYDRSFETFKSEILPAIDVEKEENLKMEFDEYRQSGGARSFKEFKKLKENK